MDRRERISELTVAVLAALKGFQSGLWTALPGIVQSFDSAKMTAVIQPAILGQFLSQDGSWKPVTMPLLLDVPVCFPNGGGFALTFPIAAGDEALVVFTSRCFDAWWQSGGVQPQAELRMHSLSDGFAIIGPRSLPKAISSISASATQLRSEDGSVFVEVAGSTIKLKATTVTVDGNLAVTGTSAFTGDADFTAEATIGGIDFSTHVHGGVQTGGGNTGGPQ